MSVQPGSPSDEVYCTADDVAIYFDKYDNGFDSSTNPTKTQVETLIEEKSDQIDRMTGHAWRERQVVDEYHDLEGPYYYGSGTPISLQKRNIRTPLDSAEGDKIEFWTGNEYRDWVSDPEIDAGRENDYWLDESTGQLHVYRRQWFWSRYKELRITYRYGKETVPTQIEQICAKLVAAELYRTQQYRVTTPGNEESPDAQAIADKWIEEAEKQLKRYKEVRSIGV